jgi:hypothetical protein
MYLKTPIYAALMRDRGKERRDKERGKVEQKRGYKDRGRRKRRDRVGQRKR